MSKDMVIYDIEDMMEILGFKRTKMTKLLTSGEFPAVKIGGQWRIRKETLEKWLDENAGKEIFI